jgi:hypothetical protein
MRGRGQKIVQGFGGKAQRKETTRKTRRQWKDGIRMDLWLGGVWLGFDWLRIGTSGGLLWVRWWTFGFLRHRVSLSMSSGPHNSAYEDDSLLWYCTSVTVVQLIWDYTAQWRTGVAVSIASGYGLDNQAIEARSLAVARDFSSSLCVQTGSGAHPASCPVGTGGPFPGGNAQPGHDADHSPPSSADIMNE